MDYRVKSFDGNKSEEDLKKERYHLEYFKRNRVRDLFVHVTKIMNLYW